MIVNIQTTVSFEHLQESKQRVVQCIGGTRSGKSYGIAQWLIVQGIESKRNISIVRKTIPSLKRTNIKDFKDILIELGIWKEDDWNSTERVYAMENGSTFTFVNTDDPDKLRGFKSDILWLDEASEMDEESYFQLSIRTSGKIILSYNPTVSPYHWLRTMVECDRYVTTYSDNPFLPKEMVDSIEALQHKNPKLWSIYGKGEFTANDKAIYQFRIIEDWDENETQFVGFGLDWGYSQDPTAVVAVYKDGNENLYVEEVLYERGLVMKDIADRLNRFGIDKSYEIWCDSSEPRSVEELYRMGFNTKAVKKGPDSIKFGISVLQNWKINILRSSQNLINEMYGYQYSTDKHGYTTDVPEEGLDHLMDALRYVALMKLTQTAQKKGTYALSIGGVRY
jgi:phage terminase large subunit